MEKTTKRYYENQRYTGETWQNAKERLLAKRKHSIIRNKYTQGMEQKAQGNSSWTK